MTLDIGTQPTLEFRGVVVPTMLYGTAWKEAETERLTTEAMNAGFLGIDTANQRKHYCEADVGRALANASRKPFLQTKFTYRRGQDDRLPYDPTASLADQVRQSFANSLLHLGTETIDSYLLHGPEFDRGISPGDWEVWQTMEELCQEGHVRLLGVSNVSIDQLRELSARATIRPAFVQNRCYASRGLDRAVRDFCDGNGMMYQGFSLLTANRKWWGDKALQPIARRLGGTPAQVVFRYAMHLGILPITGTTDPAHMRADIGCTEFVLTHDELGTITSILR